MGFGSSFMYSASYACYYNYWGNNNCYSIIVLLLFVGCHIFLVFLGWPLEGNCRYIK